MYRIDRAANTITPLKACSFGELGFRERAHLQEWIARHPAALGEELLIIQKEFAGFSDTNERLDLLALDKQGCLVVIENKLDDAGKDVTWQALKYVSYCSGMKRENIKAIFQEYLDRTEPGQSADDRLCEFFEVDDLEEVALNVGFTQRVILIAAHFRKEVTSTVLWLLNFQVRLQCFRATPYAMGESLFLDIEQIIPTPDTEEFMIGLAGKAQEEADGLKVQSERHRIRRQFWAELLRTLGARTELYRNITPQPQNWISASSGLRGVGFNFSATRTYARVELYIDRGDKAENEAIFDALLERREAIEREFGQVLDWHRIDERRACRIKSESPANIFERQQWPEVIEMLTGKMVQLEKAFHGPLAEIRERMRARLPAGPARDTP